MRPHDASTRIAAEIDPDYLESIVPEVAQLNGLDEDAAREALYYIGDTPQIGGDGKVYARLDDGRELWLVMPDDDEEESEATES